MAGYIGAKSSGIISGIDASIAELNLTDKAAANGVTEANKVLTADANKDVTAIRNLAATGAITAGGAITATGASVGALARGAIQTGNASGVAAPLSKGAAGTVLTAGANDLSWVAASAGGEATFTATGAISAGNPVGFIANGTVSVMQKQVGAGLALGSGNGNMGRKAMAYDTANNKYLHVFQGTNTKLFARVGTVSSNFGLSFGTAVDSGITLSEFVRDYGALHLVFDDNAGKFVVSYAKSDNKNYASTITISGTTPSFGTEINVFNSTTYQTMVGYDSNANKVVFVNAGNGGYARCRVGTISGTNITLGAENNIGVPSVYARPGSISFDTTANKFVLVFPTAGATYFARTLTISGTSVSAGAVLSMGSGAAYGNVVYVPSINKTVIIYTNANNLTPNFKLLTISGTSITAGAETAIPFVSSLADQGYPQGHIQAVNNPDTNGLIFGYSTDTPTSRLPSGTCVTPGTFSGSNLTLGVEVVVSATKGIAGLIYDPDTDQTVVGISLLNGTDTAEDQVVDALSGLRPSYVGVATENIANGATGKVTIIGGINANQSSLSAGTQYGIPTSSSSLVATDVNPVGIAISSTKIYIRAVKL